MSFPPSLKNKSAKMLLIRADRQESVHLAQSPSPAANLACPRASKAFFFKTHSCPIPPKNIRFGVEKGFWLPLFFRPAAVKICAERKNMCASVTYNKTRIHPHFLSSSRSYFWGHPPTHEAREDPPSYGQRAREKSISFFGGQYPHYSVFLKSDPPSPHVFVQEWGGGDYN